MYYEITAELISRYEVCIHDTLSMQEDIADSKITGYPAVLLTYVASILPECLTQKKHAN